MTFSERIGLPGALRADDKSPEATIEAVAAVIATSVAHRLRSHGRGSTIFAHRLLGRP